MSTDPPHEPPTAGPPATGEPVSTPPTTTSAVTTTSEPVVVPEATTTSAVTTTAVTTTEPAPEPTEAPTIAVEATVPDAAAPAAAADDEGYTLTLHDSVTGPVQVAAQPSAPTATDESVTAPVVVTAESARTAPLHDAAARGRVRLYMVGRTDVGLVREHNEDNFACVRLDGNVRDPAALLHHDLGVHGTLLVVCDGMGGAAAGEVASSMAVETVPEVMLSEATAPAPAGVVDDEHVMLARKLRHATEEANRRIFAEQQTNVARAGMGTTMTAALLRGDRAVIAQVGDSRAYVYRRGTLTQVTRDQSLVNQLLETGQITVEQAKYFEHSNVILQALGVQEDVEVQLSRVQLRRGDRLMLCSDGLVGVVADEEIAAVMGSIDDPAECARILIELANAAGGPDNITVVVAHLDGDGLIEPTAQDTITYETWHIDPAPPEPPEKPAPPERSVEPPAPEPPRATSEPSSPLRATELVSMALVIGLIAGSVLVGLAMYKRAVACVVHTTRPGMIIVTDGRDSGMRTAESDVMLRLRPGRHRLGLVPPGRGARAPESATESAEPQPEPQLDVEVREGDRCWVSFEREAAAEPPPAPSAAPPANEGPTGGAAEGTAESPR